MPREGGEPSLSVIGRASLEALIPGVYPDHGVIVGRRGLGGVGTWTFVDFDRHRIERFDSGQAESGRVTANPASRAVRPLSPGELGAIREQADSARQPASTWRKPPLVAPTDSTCDVVLLDGPRVLSSLGAICPPGAEPLVETVEHTRI